MKIEIGPMLVNEIKGFVENEIQCDIIPGNKYHQIITVVIANSSQNTISWATDFSRK